MKCLFFFALLCHVQEPGDEANQHTVWPEILAEIKFGRLFSAECACSLAHVRACLRAHMLSTSSCSQSIDDV